VDTKTLHVLEYSKVLERLANHCDFSASTELARQLAPTDNYELALALLADTTEARRLLSKQDLTIGGAHDVRPQVINAARGGRLEAKDLLSIQNTLVATRNLRRSLEKQGAEFPRLAELALSLPVPPGLVETISHTIGETGEVLDSASPKLGVIRREIRIAHDRLMSRLQKYITDPNTVSMLQDALITQRDGRYVIPLRAEFKGQVKSIVHDQSSSGATLFVEPLPVVELNNKYREMQLAERDEVERVLYEISQKVGEHAGEIVPGIAALAELDLTFAKAKYADELDAAEPVLNRLQSDPEKAGPEVLIRLLQARHPLLDPRSVVPIDVNLDPHTFAVIITGPNTGGKTVSLKTVGLLALMAQSGLHIPVESGSELVVFKSVWADIGDEQSIEQSLSTFSGHITNIVRILKKVDRQALVIIDELGAGTDPQEGAALARAILKFLLDRDVTTFVATHYPELKTFAHTTPGVVNASLEFDLHSLRPTYHLTIGLPGRSNALAIAERLGLPAEIITAAKGEIDPSELRTDDLLDAIHRERKLARKERQKAEKARSDVHRLRRELSERLEKIEQERQEAIDKARAEGELEVAVLQEQLKNLRQGLKSARQPLDVLDDIQEQVEILEEKIQKQEKKRVKRKPVPKGELRVGEKIILSSLKKEGVITSVSAEDVEVQIGSLRIRARLNEIQRKGQDETEVETATPATAPARGPARSVGLAASPGIELDLRGQRSEEALALLEDYLDRAFLAGMPFVRIIHGKGTGKLRSEVRRVLQGHPQINSFDEGQEKEGGSGVTVVKMVE
jgi:DNA mismatch repair protein MutS2